MNIAYFMTFPVSLKDWEENGSITRELEYIITISANHKLSFFNYGEVDEDIRNRYSQITFFELCKYNDNSFIKFLKSIVFIIKNKKIFKDINFVRSNQLWGSWLCFLVKIFYNKKFILRCGYELFFNIKKEAGIFKITIVYLISLLLYKSRIPATLILKSRRGTSYCVSLIFIVFTILILIIE